MQELFTREFAVNVSNKLPSSSSPLSLIPTLKDENHTTNYKTVPELRIYRFFDRPLGPHPIAMFEVNLFTPAQFGAFIPWLVINRGPLSALVHPNTDEEEEERNHTQRATWLGDRVPLDLRVFKLMKEAKGSL
jgi:DOPA 4,5-dioxygenase